MARRRGRRPPRRAGRRGGLGASAEDRVTHNLEVALRHVEMATERGTCEHVLHAALTAAGAIGTALARGEEAAAARAATQLRASTRKFTAWCLVKQ